MQPDMNQLFQQMQRMQKEVTRLQEELKNTQVEGSAGGGMVTVHCNGNMEFHTVKINPEAVDPNDVGVLEDLILLAVNEAIAKCQELTQKGTRGMLGGGFGGV